MLQKDPRLLQFTRYLSTMKPRGASGLLGHKLAAFKESLDDPVGLEILEKFIIISPNKEESTKIGPFVDRGVPQKSAKVETLKENLHLLFSEMLPLEKPLDVPESPFEYRSKFNADQSYISSPRLSVTSLLTRNWCELQIFYNIYSGSPRIEPSKRMQEGTSYHLKLELATHPVRDIALISELVDVMVSLGERLISEEVVIGGMLEAMVAVEWVEHIMGRLFVLATTSQARELRLCSFIDFETSQFIRNKADLSDGKGVLVSGIIDFVLLLHEDTDLFASFFKEIQQHLEESYVKKNEDYIVNFSDFITEFKSLSAKYSKKTTGRLRITDVKTRSLNLLPQQDSVVQGAKVQGMYYKKLFDLMCQDKELCYELLLRYAAVKNVDVDEPIGIKYVLLMLIRYRGLLEQDFASLCRGLPIGCEQFDKEKSEPLAGYSLDILFLEDNKGMLDEFLLSEAIEESQRTQLSDISHLDWFEETWKKPLTLRYFAARIAELFSVFEPFTSDDIAVEYHHSTTERIIGTKEYRYKEEELQESVEHAVKFWNGSVAPTPTKDLSRCKYCDYQTWCQVPNPMKKKGAVSVGQTLADFVNEKW